MRDAASRLPRNDRVLLTSGNGVPARTATPVPTLPRSDARTGHDQTLLDQFIDQRSGEHDHVGGFTGDHARLHRADRTEIGVHQIAAVALEFLRDQR